MTTSQPQSETGVMSIDCKVELERLRQKYGEAVFKQALDELDK